jgi:hypothetical protein
VVRHSDDLAISADQKHRQQAGSTTGAPSTQSAARQRSVEDGERTPTKAPHPPVGGALAANCRRAQIHSRTSPLPQQNQAPARNGPAPFVAKTERRPAPPTRAPPPCRRGLGRELSTGPNPFTDKSPPTTEPSARPRWTCAIRGQNGTPPGPSHKNTASPCRRGLGRELSTGPNPFADKSPPTTEQGARSRRPGVIRG